MRSPSLTHFRWWPRNRHIDIWRGYATFAVDESVGPFSESREVENSSGTSRTDRNPRWIISRPRTGLPERSQKVATVQSNLVLETQPSQLERNGSSQWWAFTQQQRLQSGFKGLEAVWRRLEEQKVILSPNDPDGLLVWKALLSGFLVRRELLEDLVRHAGHVRKTSGADFTFMYEGIMINALRHYPNLSLSFFSLLEKHGLVPANRAGKCVDAAVRSQNPTAAFATFKEIYLTGSERNLYDISFHTLKKAKASYNTISQWHTLLLSNGDLPSTALLSHHLVKTLLGRSKNLPFASDLVGGPSSSNESNPTYEQLRFTRDYMSTVVGEVHGIKQKSVSDAFCAKVFATGGVSTGFLVAGLAMLGLDTVGPLALRELAARSQTTKDFQAALRILKERNIAISPCVFSQALQKFAEEGRQDLYDSIVHSDRHPDTYEDRHLLGRLADTYLKGEKPAEAHAILAVLSMTSQHTDEHRWNLLVQAECGLNNPLKVATAMQDMIAQGHQVTSYTIFRMRQDLLRPRAKGKRPQITGRRDKSGEDDLRLVTNLLLSAENTGTPVSNAHWRELIKRYGMEGRIGGLQSLLLELVRITASKPAHSAGGSGNVAITRQSDETTKAESSVRGLFNATLQKAIITWGFQSDSSERWLPASLREQTTGFAQDEKWLRGITLLTALRDAGVRIHCPAVRQETIRQLAKMFRPRLLSELKPRKVMTFDDAELMRRYELIEQAWGGRGLFKIPRNHRDAGNDYTARVLCRLFDQSGWLERRERDILRHEWMT